MPRRSDRHRPVAGSGVPVEIAGYDHLEPIGRGGFSHVYSARQRDFNRRVAIKVLTFGLADEREQRSFERECRAMGLVSQHPHIVTVFNSAFTTTKQPCIVMELYSGGTMIDRQRREGRLSVATVLDVGVKIAGALQTAHDRGLLHRDIKPQNLFISEFGEPALGDFGISTLDDERSISGSGGLTVHYAPPEVLEGAEASAVSDVYSFAATLYTLLEGVRPFAGGPERRQSVGELARRIMLEDPPRPSRTDVPRSLADLLGRTMAKDPAHRPVSAAAFGHELQRIQAELGLPVTTLPVAGAGPGVPHVARPPSAPSASSTSTPPWPPAPTPTPTPTPAPPGTTPPVGGAAPSRTAVSRDGAENSPAPPPEVKVRFPDQDDDAGHTVTVGRPAVAPATPGSTPAEPGAEGSAPSTRRAVLGTAAAVVCLLGLAAALLWFGGRGGDDDTDTATTVAAGTVDVGPVIGMVPPDGVFAVTAEDGRSVRVSWNPPAQELPIERYTVRRMDGVGGAVDTPDGSTYQVTVPMDDGVPERVCFTVIAVADGGAMSRESDLACT